VRAHTLFSFVRSCHPLLVHPLATPILRSWAEVDNAAAVLGIVPFSLLVGAANTMLSPAARQYASNGGFTGEGCSGAGRAHG
jgi:hypothetical protein